MGESCAITGHWQKLGNILNQFIFLHNATATLKSTSLSLKKFLGAPDDWGNSLVLQLTTGNFWSVVSKFKNVQN